MKKSCFTLCLLFIFTSMCFAQSNITGSVLHIANNAPIEYANVILQTQSDSTFITGTVTDANGNFILNLPTTVSNFYQIQVSCIGYKTTYKPIMTNDVGVIAIEEDAQMLNEVVIKSTLPITRMKGDALVTNIEGSILEKTGTAQNMLDYIPGVISQKGNLQVLGRGNPAVYINGRLMRDRSELEQLSSDNIKTVEVITNPGARYNASVKAVIRIQTKKAMGEGLGVSNRTYVGYNKEWNYLNQLNLNYRQGKLDVFGMLYLTEGKNWEKFAVTQDTYLDNHFRQAAKSRVKREYQNVVANFGMNYVVNPEHALGFTYRFSRTPRGKSYNDFDFDITENGDLYEQSVTNSTTNGQTTNHSINLYYNGKIKNWSIDFNTDLLWIDENQHQFVNETVTGYSNSFVQEVSTFTETNNRLYAGKLVLSHPLWGGEFAFGGEYSFTKRATNYLNEQSVLDNNKSDIKEGNSAAFVEYNRAFRKLQAQVGLRYEHDNFKHFEEGSSHDAESKTYDNFFPSISISTKIGKTQVRLGYAQDISRPGFWSLRNYTHYVNRYTYETGNPFLRPSISHNISLMTIYRWWQVTASYQRRQNDVTITTVPYSETDPNIALFKPINIQDYDVARLMISATPTIGFWAPRFTLMLQKQWYEAENRKGIINMNRPYVYFRWQNSFKLPADYLFNLNAGWGSKYDTMNIRHNRSSWSMDTSISKSFLKDKLTIQLHGYDIFQTQRRNRTIYQGAVYESQKIEDPNTRSASLTVRYHFNQARNKYKGTGAGESQKNRL